MTEEVTISLTMKEATAQHVQHLQDTLAKRNAEIERLTERLQAAEAGEPFKRALEAEYKRGWQDAAGHLMEATADAARALGKVRRDAFDVYRESERRMGGTVPRQGEG